MKHALLLSAMLASTILGLPFPVLAPAGLAIQATGSTEPRVVDQLIDVGGYRLYVKCIGVGSPTVILEAGLGSSSKTWDLVVPEVSKRTRVCSYDRPGEGRSDPAPRPVRQIGAHNYIELRTGRQIVSDLHTLLAKADVSGPYVLVGHSLGGLYAILYANHYPNDIVGMVLVDSAHPDQVAREEALMTAQQAKVDREGLEQNEEGVDIGEVFGEVRVTHWRSEIPLYVLVHGLVRPPPSDWAPDAWEKRQQAWRDMQADHARRSPNSKLITAEQSGHGIQNDQPDLVIGAISQVLNLAVTK